MEVNDVHLHLNGFRFLIDVKNKLNCFPAFIYQKAKLFAVYIFIKNVFSYD